MAELKEAVEAEKQQLAQARASHTTDLEALHETNSMLAAQVCHPAQQTASGLPRSLMVGGSCKSACDTHWRGRIYRKQSGHIDNCHDEYCGKLFPAVSFLVIENAFGQGRPGSVQVICYGSALLSSVQR